MFLAQLAVGIPVAVGDLDEAHPSFAEAARHEALLGETLVGSASAP